MHLGHRLKLPQADVVVLRAGREELRIVVRSEAQVFDAVQVALEAAKIFHALCHSTADFARLVKSDAVNVDQFVVATKCDE